MSDIVIRRVEQGDLPALLAIYNHYVVHTPTTFDLDPRTLIQRQAWFDTFALSGRYQCFVAVKDGAAIGWACSGRFRPKAAYDTTVETSIYLAPGEVGKGLGRTLYRTLFDALAGEDIHRAYGVVTLPNPASEGLHRAMGFAPIGTMDEVGRKFSRFWNIGLFARPMP